MDQQKNLKLQARFRNTRFISFPPKSAPFTSHRQTSIACLINCSLSLAKLSTANDRPSEQSLKAGQSIWKSAGSLLCHRCFQNNLAEHFAGEIEGKWNNWMNSKTCYKRIITFVTTLTHFPIFPSPPPHRSSSRLP